MRVTGTNSGRISNCTGDFHCHALPSLLVLVVVAVVTPLVRAVVVGWRWWLVGGRC